MARRGVKLERWVALAAAALLCAPPAGAQEAAAPAKLGVIDVQRLLTDSAPGKEALARLKKLQEQKLEEIRSHQQEITDLRNRIAEGRLSFAEEKLAEMSKDLEDRMIAFRRLQDDADRELQKSRDEAFAQIERQVLPIINQVGREMGFTLIFNKFESGLLFAQDQVDITGLILERFGGAAGSATGGD